MAFSLNQSLTHLKIREPDLAEVYRSSNSAVPSEEQCQGRPCEAYVCAAREDDRFCVYIGFFDATTQRSVFLSTDCDVRKLPDQKRLVNEALKLTKSMGFDMEPVKLDYSAAMRQVIMRGISVMRPPAPPRPGRQHSKAVAPPAGTPAPQPAEQAKPVSAQPTSSTPAAPEAPAPPEIPSPEMAALAAEVADLKKALADMEQVKAEAERMAEQAAHAAPTPEVASPEAAALAAEVADLRKVLADMEQAKADTERMAEQTIMAIKLELERTIATYRDREEADRRQAQIMEGDTAGLRAEVAGKSEALGALEEALARETAQRREAEEKVEERDHRLEQAEEESSALRRELERLHQDTAAERLNLEQQHSRKVAGRDAEELAAAELAQSLRDELAAARQESGAVQDTLKNVLKEQQVLANEREALKAELAVLRESAGLSWQQEREDLQAAIKRLEDEQAEARQSSGTLLAEKELELKAARAELESLSARQEQLLGEKKLWDTIAGNFKKKAHKAVERLKREKQTLEEKLKELEKAPPPAPSLYPGSAAEAPPAPERHVESPFAALGLTDGGSGFTGFSSFGASAPGNGLAFRHAPDVAVISYRSADDIVELYGSANVVQAAPEGRRSQICGAYVCVVEQEGKTAIHLAWHLIDSGEVLICLPERQPEGAANYARALQDAIFYFESVGFMMDRFELSRNSHRQLKALEKIGICRMDEPGAAEGGQGDARSAAA